jgi:mannitol/fructose-specific phosphotransferase system IIA component (Ntr-type)
MPFQPGKGALANLVKGGLDDDDEAMFMIVRAEFEQHKQEKCIKWFYERLDWDAHVEKLRHTKGF